MRTSSRSSSPRLMSADRRGVRRTGCGMRNCECCRTDVTHYSSLRCVYS